MRRPLESHVAAWRTFLCRMLWLHRPEWRREDDVRVSYCSRCKVVDNVEVLSNGRWS